MAIRGMITGKDVVVHAGLIAREFRRRNVVAVLHRHRAAEANHLPDLHWGLMRILAISGSLRASSSNTALLQAASRIAPPTMRFVICQGLRELPHFDPDLDREQDTAAPPIAALRAQITAADGL